jgi:hypothetical protein
LQRAFGSRPQIVPTLDSLPALRSNDSNAEPQYGNSLSGRAWATISPPEISPEITDFAARCEQNLGNLQRFFAHANREAHGSVLRLSWKTFVYVPQRKANLDVL